MPLPHTREGFSATSNDILVASAAKTATFTSDQFGTAGGITSAVFQLVVSAASGTTPTLNATLQDSIDGGTTWTDVVLLNAAPLTTTGTTVKRINLRDTPVTDLLRLNCVIGGTTPSFTFSVRAFLIRD